MAWPRALRGTLEALKGRCVRMDCAAALRKSRSTIVDESFSTVERSHPHHYETAGEVITRERLEGLFDLVVTAIANRDLSGVSTYAETVATERFSQGFDISEVQAALAHATTVRLPGAQASPDQDACRNSK